MTMNTQQQLTDDAVSAVAFLTHTIHTHIYCIRKFSLYLWRMCVSRIDSHKVTIYYYILLSLLLIIIINDHDNAILHFHRSQSRGDKEIVKHEEIVKHIAVVVGESSTSQTYHHLFDMLHDVYRLRLFIMLMPRACARWWWCRMRRGMHSANLTMQKEYRCTSGRTRTGTDVVGTKPSLLANKKIIVAVGAGALIVYRATTITRTQEISESTRCLNFLAASSTSCRINTATTTATPLI